MSAQIVIFILAMMVCSIGLISARSLENHDQSKKAVRSSDNKDHVKFGWRLLFGDQSEEASHSFDDKYQENFSLQWIVPIVKAIKGLGNQPEEAFHSFDDEDHEKFPLQWIVPIVRAIKGLG
uniref:uncharacterized protein LOC120342639 isoform X2 n=1 Tax=Styela clava TaxID=7725 RepID=UPI0019399BB4|nr:uncharacterized protein LOC120342639 isoform X2 [Styela clava]